MTEATVSNLSIRLRDPARDVGSLFERWGLATGGSWVAGEERRAPNGRLLGGIRKDSYAYSRLKLDITVLILRDDAYGMIRWKQANMGFDDFGLTYGNPDFVKYAESYGAHGHRVASAGQVPDLLRHCLDTPGVHLIDCPVDYSENDRILNKEIKELSAQL